MGMVPTYDVRSTASRYSSCSTSNTTIHAFRPENNVGVSSQTINDTCLKKNQTTPRPSEHPPVMGEKMSKRLGGIKRLQIQNHFMAFKQVPRCR